MKGKDIQGWGGPKKDTPNLGGLVEGGEGTRKRHTRTKLGVGRMKMGSPGFIYVRKALGKSVGKGPELGGGKKKKRGDGIPCKKHLILK